MRLKGGRLTEKPCPRRSMRRVKWFYSRETREARIERIAALGLRVQGGWRLERHNCPRFTAPDEQGRVVLDWAVDVEAPAGE